MKKWYNIRITENFSVWTPDISQEHIDRIEKEHGRKIISIEEDGLDHSIKVEPKSDDNSRCMSDSNGSRMFQQGLNRFGY